MKRTRVIAPIAITAALLLAGCSAGASDEPDTDDTATPALECAPSGEASDSVEVDGDAESGFELTTKTPISAEKLERSVLSQGEGEAAAEGQGVVISTTFFNGNTGELIDASQPQGIVYHPDQADQLSPWAAAILPCATSGQLVALVGTSSETFGATAEELGVEGLTDEDSLVLVTDVHGVLDLPQKAEGTAHDAPEGFPTVELDDDGAPSITMPEGAEAPEELEVATLIEGDGEEVQPGDVVFVNYRGVIWRTGEEFDSSWSRGEPAAFSTTGVIEGFTKALEGYKVGSQIISVVPPEAGYGDQLTGMGHEADDVMVFVLDILGTAGTR